MKNVKIMPVAKYTSALMLLIPILAFIIYLVTSGGHTPYDYFTRLSASFLEGKYYLTDNPPWLSELIPLGNHKFTFVNPPVPAILLVPFSLLFGNNLQQQHFAHFIGAAAVAAIIYLSRQIKKDVKFNLWAGILLGFGTIYWFLASVGSVWYLGQVTAVLFLILALAESLGKKRLLLIGVFLYFAYFSRLQTALSLPFFIFLLRDKITLRNFYLFFTPILFFVLSYFFYNYIRFGNPLENGYTLIPNILSEPWFSDGQFSLSYIKKHLELLLIKLPNYSPEKFPYIWPSWAGMAIWISTPAFVYALFANWKNKDNLMAWITILLIGLINFSYGSTGFTQFGYRYAVDFYPFLIFLTLRAVGKSNLKWHHWLLLVISILVNLWGVLWINKFDWVSF